MKWVFPTIAALLAVLFFFFPACDSSSNKDSEDGQNESPANDDDDDDNDDNNDDNDNDDQSGENLTLVQSEAKNILWHRDDTIDSCDEVPNAGYGEPVGFETLVCDGVPMYIEQGGGISHLAYQPYLSTTIIQSQEELEVFISGHECEVDFEQELVLLVGTTSLSGDCASTTFCGIYEKEGILSALVYYFNCFGGAEVEIDVCHLVKVSRANLPIIFEIYEHKYKVM